MKYIFILSIYSLVISSIYNRVKEKKRIGYFGPVLILAFFPIVITFVFTDIYLDALYYDVGVMLPVLFISIALLLDSYMFADGFMMLVRYFWLKSALDIEMLPVFCFERIGWFIMVLYKCILRSYHASSTFF